jgi:hypothetical protein
VKSANGGCSHDAIVADGDHTRPPLMTASQHMPQVCPTIAYFINLVTPYHYYVNPNKTLNYLNR